MSQMPTYVPPKRALTEYKFVISMGPIFASGEKGMDLVENPRDIIVIGTETKYVSGIDSAFLHVLNKKGDVVFLCHTSMVLYVQAFPLDKVDAELHILAKEVERDGV